MDSIKVRCEVRSRISVSCPHLDLADLHLHGWLGSGQLFTCGLGACGHPHLVEQQVSSNWASGQRQAKNSSEAGALTWGYVQEGGAGLKADTCRAVESCSLDAHERTGHCRLTSGTAVSRGHSRQQLPPSGGPAQMPPSVPGGHSVPAAGPMTARMSRTCRADTHPL